MGVEEDLLRKMEKKSNKNKKNEANALEESSECRDAMPERAKDRVELSKDGKKKKNKKKHEISDDFEHNLKKSEAENVEDHVEVDIGNNEEKDQKKKKKRKLEVDENEKEYEKVRKKDKRINNDGEATKIKEASNEKTHVEGEENRSLQVNSGYDGELEARKDKKKRHKKNTEIKETSNEKTHEEGEENRSLQVNLEYDGELEARKDKKKRHKKYTEIKEASNEKTHEEGEENRSLQVNSGYDGELETRKDKKKRHEKNTEIKEASNEKTHLEGEENRSLQVNSGYDGELEARKNKKKRHKKNTKRDGIDVASSLMENLEVNKMGRDKVAKGRKTHEKEDIAKRKSVEEGNRKKKKKKGKTDKEGSDVEGKKSIADGKEVVQTTDLSENAKSKGKSKRVSFSAQVEVFPSSDGPSVGEEHQEEELVRGKRFSPEEDEMVKEAVLHYIKSQGLGEEGLDMVLHCKSHPEVRNCWKKIGAALPWRPYQAIYYRAHMLFERDDKRKWTPEEYELVRRFHEKHGSDWRMLADALGKHRFHVKDTWRRIKLPNRNKGQWSQEEYQNLFDLVNMDLRMKAFQEKKSKHGMLRDNICWEAISEKLSTRITSSCCLKWYNQLSSPMVAEGEWEDADDYRLLIALFSLDACCMEDVDWDYLLEHRSGDLCRKRWNQMVRHIGEHGNKSFAEQVEILSNRYCPDVLEAREAYDSRPAVP